MCVCVCVCVCVCACVCAFPPRPQGLYCRCSDVLVCLLVYHQVFVPTDEERDLFLQAQERAKQVRDIVRVRVCVCVCVCVFTVGMNALLTPTHPCLSFSQLQGEHEAKGARVLACKSSDVVCHTVVLCRVVSSESLTAHALCILFSFHAGNKRA